MCRIVHRKTLIPLCFGVTVVRYFIPEILLILALRAHGGWEWVGLEKLQLVDQEGEVVC